MLSDACDMEPLLHYYGEVVFLLKTFATNAIMARKRTIYSENLSKKETLVKAAPLALCCENMPRARTAV